MMRIGPTSLFEGKIILPLLRDKSTALKKTLKSFIYLNEKKAASIYLLEHSRGGGIGRRKGLKIPRWVTNVPVRVRPSALPYLFKKSRRLASFS
jgi:hypothetical protein